MIHALVTFIILVVVIFIPFGVGYVMDRMLHRQNKDSTPYVCKDYTVCWLVGFISSGLTGLIVISCYLMALGICNYFDIQ